MAALDGDDADGGDHGVVGDGEDAAGGVVEREIEGAGDRGDCGFGAGRIERHAAAEEVLRQVAEDDVGVGDGGLGAAGAVAGRAGAGAGGDGADEQGAAFEPGDGAAAGADGDHVDHWQRQGPGADAAALGECGFAALEQADVGAGAADVDGDEVRDAHCGADCAGADDAGGGAGQGGDEGRPADGGGAGDAAVGLHEQQGGADAGLGQPGFEAGDVGGDGGHDAGVQGRGQGALVLADFGQDIDGGGDGEAGQFGAEDFGDAPFMAGVGEGVEEADGDGLHVHGADAGGGVVDAGFVERGEDGAAGSDALGDFEDVARRDGALGFDPGVEVGGARDVLAADFEDVAEAGGGDEGGAGALGFEDQVGRDGGAVEHAGDVRRVRPGGVQDEAHPGQEGFGRVLRGGGGLDAQQAAGGGVLQRDVGEGAADVDGDDEGLGSGHGGLVDLRSARRHRRGGGRGRRWGGLGGGRRWRGGRCCVRGGPRRSRAGRRRV